MVGYACCTGWSYCDAMLYKTNGILLVCNLQLAPHHAPGSDAVVPSRAGSLS